MVLMLLLFGCQRRWWRRRRVPVATIKSFRPQDQRRGVLEQTFAFHLGLRMLRFVTSTDHAAQLDERWFGRTAFGQWPEMRVFAVDHQVAPLCSCNSAIRFDVTSCVYRGVVFGSGRHQDVGTWSQQRRWLYWCESSDGRWRVVFFGIKGAGFLVEAGEQPSLNFVYSWHGM